MSESEKEPIEELIDGCESFVVEQIEKFRTETREAFQKLLEERLVSVRDEMDHKKKSEIESLNQVARQVKSASEKVLAECDQKLFNHDREARNRIDELEAKVDSQNARLESQRTEIADLNNQLSEIKEQRPCSCKTLFDAYVDIGKSVFSGKKVSVIEESTIEESFIDYTIEDANPVEDASPRVIVQRLPSATTQPLICAVLAGRGRSETSQIYIEIEWIPDDIRDSVSKYYSKRSSLSLRNCLVMLRSPTCGGAFQLPKRAFQPEKRQCDC